MYNSLDVTRYSQPERDHFTFTIGAPMRTSGTLPLHTIALHPMSFSIYLFCVLRTTISHGLSYRSNRSCHIFSENEVLVPRLDRLQRPSLSLVGHSSKPPTHFPGSKIDL